jgi:TolB protein
MSPTIYILFAIFTGEILLLLLAGWIYLMLQRSGAFGMNPRIRRAGAALFILLPVVCGLTLFPSVLIVTTRTTAGNPLPFFDLPGSLGSAPGRIVYTCQVFRDSSRDQICLMDEDGTGQRRLTQNDRADYNFPSLSPNGDQVIFVGDEGSGYEIFEIDLGTGERNRISEGMADASAPEISPNGRQIVFARRSEEHQTIWVMGRDGSDPHQVFGPPEGDGWDPVWSPDGRQILFASNREGEIQLYAMDASGGNLRQISRLEGIRGRNDWSPDGDWIATYAGPSWEHEIYLIDPDGENSLRITEGGNNLAPSFSPDGSWITFTSYRDQYRDENGCEIYVMRLDGSDITRLTENDTCDWQPRWGP